MNHQRRPNRVSQETGGQRRAGKGNLMDDTTAPITPEEWREFLERYSAQVLTSEELAEHHLADLDSVAEVSASEQVVAALEERIGTALPPSYRNFLLATDGYENPAKLSIMLPAEQVDWARVVMPDLIEAWEDFDEEVAMLERCLLIGDNCANSYFFLDPTVVEGGEWAAIDWFYKPSEPVSHPSFGIFVVTTLLAS